MTRFHAHVTFANGPGASAGVVAAAFRAREWAVVDEAADEVFVVAEHGDREAAHRSLADMLALLQEAGFERPSALGPVTDDELYS